MSASNSFTNADVGNHNDLTALRIGLHRNGYHPVPVSDPNPMLSNGGKAPFMRGWQQKCALAEEAEVASWTTGVKRHGNTGILCGEVSGVDIDVPVPGLAAHLSEMADAILGPTPLHRIGKAPKSLRCYRATVPMKKMETPELLLPDGTKLQVEVMGVGQQFVAYGIHPGTGRPYTWPDNGPDTVPLSDLPEVDEDALRDFLRSAEEAFRAAGAMTEKERVKADASKPDQPAADGPKVNRPKGAASTDFFKAVNKAALENIEPWFRALFPNCRREDGTGCWRVASADLGRSLEEDISVHPTEGGHDFGTRKSCSAIDLVMQWGGAPNAQDAAFWLCEQLGRLPSDCGWREPKAKAERPKREERADTDKPLIRLSNGNLHINATEAEDAILAAGVPVYQRGSMLVRPTSREVPASDGRTTVVAGLCEMTVASLIDVLSAVADWEKFDARATDWVRANPPKLVAEILLARNGSWRLPSIAGVITTPTLRPDGSVLDSPGYDPATHLYHVADPTLRLHPAVHKPTRADAEKALALLVELLAGFPLVDGVSKAVAVSALLTPVARGAFAVVPMHVFRAPTPGSGKSYLADVSSSIATGRVCPAASASVDPVETEKRLTGYLLAGFPLISLDNVNGELGGDFLCQAVERQLVSVRPLGRSDIAEIESRSTMFGNGNQVQVSGDMVRRTLLADLDAKMERPEEREFKFDPVARVMADRSRYVSACLIIVRAYHVAGRPSQGLTPLQSFEPWSNTVRAALVWLGMSDPAASIKQTQEDDPVLGELLEVMTEWDAAFGSVPVTARRAVEVATTPIAPADENGDVPHHRVSPVLPYPGLHDAFLRLAGNRGVVDADKLGKWLRSRRGRPAGGRRFVKDGDTGGTTRWKLESLR